MKIGITATRKGLSTYQLAAASGYLRAGDIVHHGDCIGGDAQVHDVAVQKGCSVIIHPSNLTDQRAYKQSDVILTPRDPIERNHIIVDETEMLLAFPSSNQEVLRSGTWATVRYARKSHMMVHIIYPDGHWDSENA